MDDDQANSNVYFKLLKLIKVRDTLEVVSAFKQMKKVLQSLSSHFNTPEIFETICSPKNALFCSTSWMVSVHIYSMDTEQYNKHIEITLFSRYSYDLIIITCEHLK